MVEMDVAVVVKSNLNENEDYLRKQKSSLTVMGGLFAELGVQCSIVYIGSELWAPVFFLQLGELALCTGN